MHLYSVNTPTHTYTPVLYTHIILWSHLISKFKCVFFSVMCTLCYIFHGHNKAQFYIFPLIKTHPDSIPKHIKDLSDNGGYIALTVFLVSIKNRQSHLQTKSAP